jgi:hypothetical protein
MATARTVRALAVMCLIFGCAPRAGVQQAGADTFVASARAPGGNPGVLLAQSAALQDARDFCKARGRRFLSVADQVAEDTFSYDVTFTVRFRCPAADAPELPRPTVNEAPDQIF